MQDSHFDIIGDIHGRVDLLVQLLEILGYQQKNGIYAHPTRRAIFLGDYIDRGPYIRDTLHLVRSMSENGNAIALMGNHEYSAVCFHTLNKKEGGYLRPHNIRSILMHYETFHQFKNLQAEYDDFIEWMTSLPLWYQHEKFCAVHACWNTQAIAYIIKTLKSNALTNATLQQGAYDNLLQKAIREVLSGTEIALPNSLSFTDREDITRTHYRLKWWHQPKEITYQSLAVDTIAELPNDPLPQPPNFSLYHTNVPIFFGHYWFQGTPKICSKMHCCLDYSAIKSNILVAYRFDNEPSLDNKKIVATSS